MTLRNLPNVKADCVPQDQKWATRDGQLAKWNPGVCMIEHGRRVQQDFKNDHGNRRGANQIDNANFQASRKQNLDRMKPGSGRDIDVDIGVMHAVKLPQRFNAMED